MMRLLTTLLFALLACFAPTPAHAHILYVDINLTTGANDGSSWANAYRDTDCLVDAALATNDVDGDLICVAGGTYTTGGVTTWISLYPNTTIVGGYISGDDWRAPSGSAQDTIVDADLSGGSKTNILFAANNAANVSMQRLLLRDISAVAGVAISAIDSDLSLREVHFVSCVRLVPASSTVVGAGALRFHCDIDDRALRVYDCFFDACGGVARGGAIEVLYEEASADAEPEVIIHSTVFRSNDALDGVYVDASGGALWAELEDVEAEIVNCLFVENTSESLYGGAVYAKVGDATLGGALLLQHCTFNDNEAPAGAAAWLADGASSASSIVVRSCIFWGDAYTTGNTFWGEVYGPTTTQIYDSCLEDFLAAAFTTSGVIDTDPLFVAGTSRMLSSTSPCIDTGSTTLPDDRFDLDGDLSTTDDLPVDYFGDPRSVDGDANSVAVPDMGFHEYQV